MLFTAEIAESAEKDLSLTTKNAKEAKSTNIRQDLQDVLDDRENGNRIHARIA
jgi:hypothetical protein